MTNEQIEKLARILNNEKVVCSDKDLDAMIEADKNNDNSIMSDIITIPNPNRCGILDAYLAYKKGVI